MLSLLADENLDGNIVRGVLRRVKGLNLARVQDLGLSGLDDPTILQWAAEQGRILVTHDVQTVTRFAYERVEAGLPMPGGIEVISSDDEKALAKHYQKRFEKLSNKHKPKKLARAFRDLVDEILELCALKKDKESNRS